MPTLYQLRQKSGMGLAAIVQNAREIDPFFPATHVGLIKIEQRGTTDYWQIKALSGVYNYPMEEMALIARPTNRKNLSNK